MSRLQDLSQERVLLLAVQFTSESDLETLRELAVQRLDVLDEVLVHRLLLTYLPLEPPSEHLITLLRALARPTNHGQLSEHDIDISSVDKLGASETRHLLARIHLLEAPDALEDSLSAFLIARADQLDSAAGDLRGAFELSMPFVDENRYLRTWLVSTLLPLLRLRDEYYPDKEVGISLKGMQDLREQDGGVSKLLEYTMQARSQSKVSRDLRGVVAPWICGQNGVKRRKLDDGGSDSAVVGRPQRWHDVNEWILSRCTNNFSIASQAVMEWAGPKDVDFGGYGDLQAKEEGEGDTLRYAQVALAVIYAASAHPPQGSAGLWDLLNRASFLATLPPPERSSALPDVPSMPHISGVTKATLFHNSLLQPDNMLTMPSPQALAFLHGILASLDVLARYQIDMSVREAAEICLFGSAEQQTRELHRLLQQISTVIRTGVDWNHVRKELLWLQTWRNGPHPPESNQQPQSSYAIFGKVEPSKIEVEILRAMLAGAEYDRAIDIYVADGSSGPLPLEEVESCVLAAIYTAYDNASNGNRTRGGVKRADDMLKAFQPHFPNSGTFRRISQLIAATHSLSFYQLILQHGVPFQPVSIRVHKDPLALIDKVLEQNAKAYTKLDDLVTIGRNLVLAQSAVTHEKSRRPREQDLHIAEAEHRVTYSAIISALSSHDFDTAYSYITTRLSPVPSASTSADDASWRAAYAAGRYRPSSTPQSHPARIANLSKRMDLLSLALTLCPSPDSLPDILHAWLLCEEEMENVKQQEIAEERALMSKSYMNESAVPGGFDVEDRDADMADTKRAMDRRAASSRMPTFDGLQDEAPMSLFEVARGAASAIRKSAFPLGAQAQHGLRIQDGNREADDQLQRSLDDAASGSQRVRKRDLVSNMVTGGLATGMNWMLGPTHATRHSDEEDDEDA